MDWYRYSCTIPGKHRERWYFMPHNATDLLANGENYTPPKNAKLCTEALQALMDVKEFRMTTICKLCSTTGVVKPHGNKGKSNAIQENNIRMGPFREHFEELLNLGEDRSTRFMWYQ
mmetsp:Transcript_27887/g.50845  ORF Transcript_27887/g.50845 Transcript_27887/m.50845 type:complete len:117 (+) Transcript_27887:280-630(+)